MEGGQRLIYFPLGTLKRRRDSGESNAPDHSPVSASGQCSGLRAAASSPLGAFATCTLARPGGFGTTVPWAPDPSGHGASAESHSQYRF